MYNGVSVTNCYNAGSATYAIAGNRYNNTATITNSYFLGSRSTKSTPDYNQTTGNDEVSNEITTRATAVSAAVMASSEFAELMGDAFVQSCPTPVLSWQTAVSHTGDVCENCSLGSTEKEIYDVTFQIHNGYTLSGNNKVTQGAAYTFNLTISEGYKTAVDFKVKVNGKAVEASSDGSYTVIGVDGPLSITVVGVQLIPGAYAITLPADGYGYRVTGAKTVKDGEDYTFTLAFVDGFKAGENFKVIAQQVLSKELLDQDYIPEEIDLTESVENGVYTFAEVRDNYKIIVSGVEVVSSGITATVNFSITEGYNEFHISPGTETLMMDQIITVPYFDLSLYGLERYYYNPYCYVDENGNLRGQQQKGTPESAYDNITVMHAFIVATEIFYFEYDADMVGKGLSYASDPEAFNEAISWSQGAGSSFMDFWDFGTNLNYYVNYEYPLAYEGWGSTSDQITIEDGDVLSVHMITGNASGSRFGFFVVNDTDGKHTKADVVDSYEVDQGEKVNLTLYWTATTGDYSTGYEVIANTGIYWIAAGDEVSDVRYWNTTKLGVEPEPDAEAEPEEDDEPTFGIPIMTTNSKGIITISTVGVEPGTYYIAAPGGWTKGGAVDNAGFQSAGGETGVAYFKLTVNEYEGKLGDVNGDAKVNSADAAVILQYGAGIVQEINAGIADVTGDGKVNSADAAAILQYGAGIILEFPAEQNS